MAQDKLVIRGAREHNLKNIDVTIPRDRLVVITGLSGSGKSSLAFDTIFAEGQRRYVESLSAYARQFLGQMDKPDVDQIEGLSPSISIDQKSVSNNPRSTVGTVTEIYDYLRLLYARIGIPHCPVCGERVEAQSPQQIVDAIERWPDGTRIQVLAPVIKDRKGRHEKVLQDIQQAGFVRVRVNGEVHDVSEDITLERYKRHTIDVVVDRLVVHHFDDPDGEEAASARSRLTDSVETAMELGDGVVIVNDVTDPDTSGDHLFSEHLACVHGHVSLPEIEPRMFSFNSPHGACPTCQGLGVRREFDPDLIVPNQNLTLNRGALHPWATGSQDSWTRRYLRAVCKHFDIPMNVPWRDLTPAQHEILLYGTDEKVHIEHYGDDGSHFAWNTNFEGVLSSTARRYRETTSEGMRARYEEYMSERPCDTCHGNRLRPEAQAVTIAGEPIHVITDLPIKDLLRWVQSLRGTGPHVNGHALLSERDLTIAHQILKEIEARAQFMVNVGLDYLTLSRAAGSLSGGEAQRIRLATQIGSQLTGVLYVLDEPSIGLHQRDNARLIQTLEGMRDLGNTLLVVEHDHETMLAADWIIDLGPGAGEHGGEVVAAGTPDQIMDHPTSITGAYLSGRKCIPLPAERRTGNGHALVIRGARENNLKNIDVKVPLGKLVVITGVSGSGKSTLMIEVLYKKLAQLVYGSKSRPGAHDDIEGVDLIDKVIHIDQSPIGRTPRSNPGTYTKVFDAIRSLFAELPESKIRGYAPGRFSFNVKGGRCEHCAGEGQLRIEMQFLPDVYVPCEVCHGARYNHETLQVRYKGKSIAGVLDMTVSEGLAFFENIPAISNKLATLAAVGLGYIRIGQPAPTLSGGEAQRVKLSRELSKRATGQTLYVLDEPSTGLHTADVAKLIEVLQTLVDSGNTVLIIEHNPDIIKVADHIIDLGPEGGDDGGYLIAEGTPEAVAEASDSHTGRFLADYLEWAASLDASPC
ncbi:MAG: excinuclease ABC subunit UvrA [Anaerolineae bacterium]|nr:excinuclease ABC subunit UvrA [Anaerolineae bacterium]